MTEGNFEIQQPHPESVKKRGHTVKNDLVETIITMDEKNRAAMKKFKEVIPQGRNFDIELQESESGINLLLKQHNGQEKDLSVFLPSGYSFATSTRFMCDRDLKKINFPVNMLPFRGFILSLFHEIGHSQQTDESPKITGREFLKLMMWAVYKSIKNFGSDTEYTLPGWYWDKLSPHQATSERGAWAFALRTLRNLQREGYDVFAGFENFAQIKTDINYCLSTFDLKLVLDHSLSGNVEKVSRLMQRPPFSRKNAESIIV